MLPSRFHSIRPAFCRTVSHTVHIPKADVHRFGDSTPLLRNVEWTAKTNESWAIISSGSGEKTALFQLLLGQLKIIPHPPEGLLPFLSAKGKDPYASVSFVSFSHRMRAAGGAFYDYTARYGAVRDEDRVTLRQSMFPETIPSGLPAEMQDILGTKLHSVDVSKEDVTLFDELSDRLGLKPLLDLPLIALSNGQTRRARILKAILSKPELLLLDEPLTGLDVQSRPNLLNVLYSLHMSCKPRIIMGLRVQDPIPEWITHLAYVRQGSVTTGERDRVLSDALAHTTSSAPAMITQMSSRPGTVVVDLKNVKVQYSNRVVLQDINWKIRQGERWHLQGANGSGKTTLLSLITGDHPQSYTQESLASHLHLFGKPRPLISTPHLQSLLGIVSPELFDAFPRRTNMTVWDAVSTGFDGNFVPSGKERVGLGVLKTLSEEDIQWRISRMWEVLNRLGPQSWRQSSNPDLTEQFQKRAFLDLPAGEQRMVLLMRALVGRPQLVLLDEVWSGMDEAMISAARDYLRNGGVGDDQAVVVISHWAEEVPWRSKDGVKRFLLEGGQGRIS